MTVELVNRIPGIIATSDEGAAALTDKTAHDIEGGCKERSRVDTGQMRDGWQAEQIGHIAWEVFNPVEHTIYNEFGTVDMSAQPMLHPAVDEARPGFEAGVAQLYEVR